MQNIIFGNQCLGMKVLLDNALEIVAKVDISTIFATILQGAIGRKNENYL